MSKKDRIDQLKKDIAVLTRKISDSKECISQMTAQAAKDTSELKDLENQLKQITPRELVVSDHAVLRYAERHHGFDFDRVRAEIVSQLELAGPMGDCKISGFTIRGNTVVTYYA